MSNRKLTTIDPRKLIKHPTSLKVYGEQADAGFDESILARGVDEPIVVAADGKTIISGVRRRNGAIKAGLKTVDIIVRTDLVKDIDIREAIIEANRHNEQTNEAKARAFAELKLIEEERAALRQKSGRDLSPHVDEGQGRSDDNAADKVGLGRTTARKAAAVVEKLDKVTSKGKDVTATDIRETLNTSVSKAYEVNVPSEAYQAAFKLLPRAVQVLIKERPSIASEKTVITMSKMDHGELSQLARSVRVDDFSSFDGALKALKPAEKPKAASKKGKAPAKQQASPPAQSSAKSFAESLIRLHIEPLKRGLDHLATLNGGRGECHESASFAVGELTGFVRRMGAKEQ